jgi:dihydrofolate synthase / folylpolyglutamate synthase
MSAYADLLSRLLPARRFGVVLGLERVRGVLDRLGDPDARMGTVVHIAGTNGKGSTVAMLSALLRPHLRVASYTSPHLSCLRERIVIDGEMIDEATIVDAGDRVRAAGGDELTFFEQVTAIACVAIADASVDVSILEVGLGGRLDATNTVDAQIAVVTGVAMDHEAILGRTLAEIAGEKAGIFAPGQRAVIGASGEPAAVPLLREAAKIVSHVPSHITVIDEDMIAAVPPLAMPGAHQRRNAAAALAVIDHLEALKVVKVPKDARKAALAEVRHPGRYEVVDDVILDGAHNPHGAGVLVDTLRERDVRPVLVIAIAADKDVRAMAAVLAPAVRAVVATRFQQDRALPPEQLAAVFAEAGAKTEHAPDLAAAMAAARLFGGPILVAGSLFLVGEARVMLLGAPADPFVVTDPSAKSA